MREESSQIKANFPNSVFKTPTQPTSKIDLDGQPSSFFLLFVSRCFASAASSPRQSPLSLFSAGSLHLISGLVYPRRWANQFRRTEIQECVTDFIVDSRRVAVPLEAVIIAGPEEGAPRPVWGRRHGVASHAKPQCSSWSRARTLCLALLVDLLLEVNEQCILEQCIGGLGFVAALFLLAIRDDWPLHGLQSHLRD